MDEWGQSRGEEKKNERKDRGVGRSRCLSHSRGWNSFDAASTGNNLSGRALHPLKAVATFVALWCITFSHLCSLIDKSCDSELATKAFANMIWSYPFHLS